MSKYRAMLRAPSEQRDNICEGEIGPFFSGEKKINSLAPSKNKFYALEFYVEYVSFLLFLFATLCSMISYGMSGISLGPGSGPSYILMKIG